MLELLVESSQTVEVKKDKKSGDFVFEGVFAVAKKRNLNGRLYPYKVMDKAIKEYNENFINKKRGLGSLDHEEDASINLKNVAFIIDKPLTLDEESGEVRGKGRILKETPLGKIAYELMKEGITVGISSRGLGEVTERKEFDEELNEEVDILEVSDYSLSCFDLVSEPSIGVFVSNYKQEEKVEKKEENKIEEKKIFSSEDLKKLNEILFEE